MFFFAKKKSRASRAISKNCDLNSVEDGFSMLDIVKHAINAVMHMLNENDRISLVTFNTHAKVIFPLTSVTVANKKLCKTQLFA